MGVRAVAREVRIGQRWRGRKGGQLIVVYQCHRAERRVEAYAEGGDPRARGGRFYVGFQELASKYELLDAAHA